MGISKNLQIAFEPNIDQVNIKDLYVDTGDFNRLLEKLFKPQTFLIHGERGAGKTLLFNLLKTELAASLAEYYENKDFLKQVKDVLFLKKRIKKRAIVPVFLRITRAKGTQKELLFDTIHEIIRNTSKALLLARKVSNNKIFKNYEPQLAELLARLEEKEISQVTRDRVGLKFNIGGKIIPLELGTESSEEFSKARSAKPIKELRTLHSLGEDLMDIVRSENIELIVALDEFDKIGVSEASEILKSEQGPLFEALRSNFSFLIPATPHHIQELEKPEYLGIFTTSPFELTPFDLAHTKEMINKRLVFYKEHIGKKLEWNSVLTEEKLKQIMDKSEQVPRIILRDIQKEIDESKKFPMS
jgi:archaellum biogenesis ATPase FlaH